MCSEVCYMSGVLNEKADYALILSLIPCLAVLGQAQLAFTGDTVSVTHNAPTRNQVVG